MIEESYMSSCPKPDVWVPFRKPNARSRVRLFCFAHAGGSASFFERWSADLPPEVELCSVQLPGRETRLDEPAFQEAHAAADAAADVLAPVYGPSYGDLRPQHGRAHRIRGRVPIEPGFAAGAHALVCVRTACTASGERRRTLVPVARTSVPRKSETAQRYRKRGVRTPRTG